MGRSMKRKRIATFEFPLPRTHAGVAMGNGMFGALVWGVDKLHITVNRSDFWDHRGAEFIVEGMSYERLKAADDPSDPSKVQDVFQKLRQPMPPGVRYPTRLPMGRFELTLQDGTIPARGELDVGTGVLSIRMQGKGKETLRLALHPRRPLLLIKDPSGLVTAVKARPSWEWVGDEFTSMNFKAPSRFEGDGLVGWAQECPDDPAMAAVAKSETGRLLIGMCPGADADAARAATLAEFESAPAERTFLAETRAWWRKFWDGKPEIELPSKFFSMFMDYAVYRFACATNPNSALPCALQGPWVEEYQFPPWCGDYTVNENIQQIYTLAFPCGATDHLAPLFDWLESLKVVMRRNAKLLFGIDDGLLLTHSVDDRGAVLQGGLCTMGALDQGCLAWLAQLSWLQYLHTGDKEFLRARALPLMRGVMRVYEAMLEPDGDSLALALSVSPEYGQPVPCDDPNQFYNRLIRNGRNSSFQLAAIHLLADALIKTASELGVEPEESWLTVKRKTPPYTLVGAADNQRIAVWEGQDLAVPHRHHSHLASIYPFDTLGEPTPDQREVIENSIDHWVNLGLGDASEWSMPWSAIILARTGRPEAAYEHLRLWRDLFLNEGFSSVYIPRFKGISLHVFKKLYADGLRNNVFHKSNAAGMRLEDCEIMQLDGMMGAASAIYELLVQTRGESLHVFPAIPRNWRNLTFRGIRAAGGLSIDGAWKDGRAEEVVIRGNRAHSVRLHIGGLDHATLQQEGMRREVAMPCTLKLPPGGSVQLTPG